MLVRDWMSKNVVTVDVKANMQEAITLMMDHDVSVLPVMEGGRLVGIVTDRDIRRAAPSSASLLDVRHVLYHLTRVEIGAIMCRDLITIPPDFTVEETADVLLKRKISGCPVLDRDGNLIGIVTKHDLFKAIVSVSGLRAGGIQFGFLLEDRPDSIKKVTDIIQKHGARAVSIISAYEKAPEGHRYAYVRISNVEPNELRLLEQELKKKTRLLYMVDHVQNKREIYPSA